MADPVQWIDSIQAAAGQPPVIDSGEAVLRAYVTPSADPGNALILANDALPYSSANDRPAESIALPINAPWVAMGEYGIAGLSAWDPKDHSLITVYPNAATNPVFPGNNSPDGYPVGFAHGPGVTTNIDANNKSWEIVSDPTATPAGQRPRVTFDLRDPNDPGSGYGDYSLERHSLSRWGRLVTLSIDARNTAWTKTEAAAISAPETYKEWVVSSGIPAGWQPRHPRMQIFRGPGSEASSGTFMYVTIIGSEVKVRFMKQPKLLEHLTYDAGRRMLQADGIDVLPVPAVGSRGPSGRGDLKDCFIAAYRGEDTDVCPVGPLVYASDFDGQSIQYGETYLGYNIKYTGSLNSPYVSGSGIDPSELWTQINLNLFFGTPGQASQGQQISSIHPLGSIGNVADASKPRWQTRSISTFGQREHWSPMSDVYPDSWTYFNINVSWLC